MKLNIKIIWFSVVVIGGTLASYLIYTFEQNEKELINQGQSTILWIQNSLAEKMASNKTRAKRMALLQIKKDDSNKYSALEKKINFTLLDTADSIGPGIIKNGDGSSKYIDSVWVKDEIYYFSQSLESLLGDIIREDFFDLVALVDNKHLHFQSKIRMLNEVMNDTLLASYFKSDLGVNHTQVVVTDEKYEAFFRPIHLYQQDFILLGLMKTSSYDKARRQVPFSLLNVVFLLLILIISSIPIFRVFSLASGDQLGKSHVLECGISIVLLATVPALQSAI